MQLRSFKAQGFKNFRQPVLLEDLGPVNVIHGPNNVGKSNLLQAIKLFFFLMGLDYEFAGTPALPMQTILPLSDDTLAQAGLPRTDIFNLKAPLPIQIEALIVTEPAQLLGVGLDPALVPFERVRIAVELRWMGNYVAYTVLRFETEDGKEHVKATKTISEVALYATFAKLVALSPRSSTVVDPRLALVPVERLASDDLALALYDAQNSAELDISRRWDRFAEAMAKFEDILGKGSFVVVYDRRLSQAQLLYQTSGARSPLRLLGSGVQQLAALLGAVLVSGAAIAGIEEPELNLRYTLQLRLREVLAELVSGPGGLEQLFITSHSDAFEAGQQFYFMEPTPDGPRVEKRRTESVREALGMTTEVALPDPNAVLCYISTDGVVRVPPRICDAIKLPNGGGVVFIERDGVAEMMSDDTFADRFEPKNGGGDNDA
jgi:AAA domain, putative AbiEii toxin, Type IV TA system